MAKIFEASRSCLFCNTLKYNPETKEANWRSNIILDLLNQKIIFTICPKHRNKKINEIYDKLIKRGFGA